MLMAQNDDIFPKNLSYLRKKRKLSQTKLAQLTGINVYLLRGIERGRFCSQLSCAQYLCLCRLLDISPSVMGSFDIILLCCQNISFQTFIGSTLKVYHQQLPIGGGGMLYHVPVESDHLKGTMQIFILQETDTNRPCQWTEAVRSVDFIQETWR